jgi:hypothetical protein
MKIQTENVYGNLKSQRDHLSARLSHSEWEFPLSIGYRTFQTKEMSFIGSGRLLFPHEYTGEGRDVEAFTCVRVRKKKLSIFYNGQFFCLKCTVSNLYNN